MASLPIQHTLAIIENFKMKKISITILPKNNFSFPNDLAKCFNKTHNEVIRNTNA